jgi:hypothetical protein
MHIFMRPQSHNFFCLRFRIGTPIGYITNRLSEFTLLPFVCILEGSASFMQALDLTARLLQLACESFRPSLSVANFVFGLLEDRPNAIYIFIGLFFNW